MESSSAFDVQRSVFGFCFVRFEIQDLLITSHQSLVTAVFFGLWALGFGLFPIPSIPFIPVNWFWRTICSDTVRTFLWTLAFGPWTVNSRAAEHLCPDSPAAFSRGLLPFFRPGSTTITRTRRTGPRQTEGGRTPSNELTIAQGLLQIGYG